MRDHVHAGPRGVRARARPRHCARRPHRDRELDPDGRAVRALLGDSFDLEFEELASTLRLPTGEDYWELFSTSYGPTKTLAESIGDRREDLRRDWVEFFETNYRADGEIVHPREYLLVLGTRR